MTKARTLFVALLLPMLAVAPDTSVTPEAAAHPLVGVDSYIHIGQMFSTGGGARVDELRMASLGSIGLTLYPTSTIGVRAGAGSLLGVLGPSFEVSLAGEFHPWGAAKTGLFARLGGRGILNILIRCANQDPSCLAERQQAEEDRPAADAIGAMVSGFAGEAGIGAQLAVQEKGALFLYGSYLGGPFRAQGFITMKPVEGYYHGYLGTIGLRLFL